MLKLFAFYRGRGYREYPEGWGTGSEECSQIGNYSATRRAMPPIMQYNTLHASLIGVIARGINKSSDI